MCGQLGREDTEGCVHTLTVLKHTESESHLFDTVYINAIQT